MRLTSRDGTQLALHEYGGRGRDLLIVHATGFCAGAYRSLAETLTSRFRVFALDLRGHGDSGPSATGSMVWTGMRDDVVSAIEAIGSGDIVGFGHSLGGAALLMAQASRPGLLAGCWLFEPIVTPQRDEWDADESPLSISARRRRATFPSRAEALARYAGRPPLGLLRADCLAAYVEHGFRDVGDGVTLKCEPVVESATFEAAGAIVAADLVTIDVDAVVARGERGPTDAGPAVMALSVADSLPGATLRRFDHIGHFGPLQDPETIAEAVIDRFS